MDIASFQTSLEHWGYLLLFFASFGGGYTAIVAAGVFCALGKLDINLSLLISFIFVKASLKTTLFCEVLLLIPRVFEFINLLINSSQKPFSSRKQQQLSISHGAFMVIYGM